MSESLINQTLDNLEKTFLKEISQNADTTRLTTEKNVLAVMQTAEKLLGQERLRLAPLDIKSPLDQHEATPSSSFYQFTRLATYYGLLLVGVLQNIIGSFIFGRAVFSLIPGIPEPLINVAAGVYTCLDSIMFYAFDVSLLKEALNLPLFSSDAEILMETYSQQIKTVKSLNTQLASLLILDMPPETYTKFVGLAVRLNDHLHAHNPTKTHYKESITRKILKGALMTFGIFSSMAASYFSAEAIVSLWGISLLGSPVGIALLGVIVIAGLGYFYATNGSSMVQLVNPDYDKFQELKKEFTGYTGEYQQDLRQMIAIKNNHPKQPTCHMTTQTELIEPVCYGPLLSPPSPEKTMTTASHEEARLLEIRNV